MNEEEQQEWERLDLLVEMDPLALRDEAFRLLVELATAQQRIGELEGALLAAEIASHTGPTLEACSRVAQIIEATLGPKAKP